MANISASMVKDLREKTGVGMMDCKRALEAAGGDMEAAIEHLRKAGIAKAEKRAGKTAREGRILSAVAGDTGVLAELLCETDFVAKTDEFQALAASIAKKALDEFAEDGDISASVAASVAERMTEVIGRIGENMQVRRVLRWVGEGRLGIYRHMGGRIAVMADVVGEPEASLLNDICMHIAAFSPQFTCPDQVPAGVIAKEREIAAAQVAGKPANIVDKIVEGKINKWYTETCLSHQPWVRDDKTCLAKLVPAVRVRRFVRWQVGEEL
ncbi:MAG: elongation factor Ts [Lentisphaeria bacterium]|nr:elongation factor Ts [Lentisphaeria bacterium]